MISLTNKNDTFHFCQLSDRKAILQYAQTDNIIDMFHTEVPPAFQGKGLAKLLAKVFTVVTFFALFFSPFENWLNAFLRSCLHMNVKIGFFCIRHFLRNPVGTDIQWWKNSNIPERPKVLLTKTAQKTESVNVVSR